VAEVAAVTGSRAGPLNHSDTSPFTRTDTANRLGACETCRDLASIADSDTDPADRPPSHSEQYRDRPRYVTPVFAGVGTARDARTVNHGEFCILLHASTAIGVDDDD